MNNYEIVWSEKKTTSTGKQVISANLKDSTGATYERVSLWGDFPGFENIMTGHSVKGSIVTNDKGYKTLYPPRPENASTGQMGGNKGGFGVGMMKAKSESIAKAQENKELGIMTSSTIRMAVDCAIAERSEGQRAPMENRIEHWRQYFVNNWDIEEPKSPVDINEPPLI